MLIDLLFVILGIVVLVKSADFLVETSSDLATKLGVSAVVVGAIIVGFGTSMPEMAVSTTAAVRGDIDLGIGNVIGSIIANLTLVLEPQHSQQTSLYLDISLNSTSRYR